MTAFSFARLADYFTAVAVLGAENDPAKQAAIATLLGFDREPGEEQPADIALSPTVTETPAATTATLEAAVEVTASVTGTLTDAPPPPRRQEARRPVLTPLRAERRRPDWVQRVAPLDSPREEIARPAQPQPLLARRWSRAVLSTAMSTSIETNALDVHAVFDADIRGLPVRSMPRLVVPGLAHGAQILIDRCPASAPFLADQDLLAEQIRVVAGRDRVEVLRFDSSRRFIAGPGPRSRWRDYFSISRPLPGVIVVLLSDLGIATVPFESGATPQAWADFIARIRARGNPVIAFVPYGPARWPPLLRRLLGMVPWDRHTSVQSVRRALGRRRPRKSNAE